MSGICICINPNVASIEAPIAASHLCLGLQVIPVFAGGLDFSVPVNDYFFERGTCLVDGNRAWPKGRPKGRLRQNGDSGGLGAKIRFDRQGWSD